MKTMVFRFTKIREKIIVKWNSICGWQSSKASRLHCIPADKQVRHCRSHPGPNKGIFPESWQCSRVFGSNIRLDIRLARVTLSGQCPYYQSSALDAQPDLFLL
jgi:hypothetical protein